MGYSMAAISKKIERKKNMGRFGFAQRENAVDVISVQNDFIPVSKFPIRSR